VAAVLRVPRRLLRKVTLVALTYNPRSSVASSAFVYLFALRLTFAPLVTLLFLIYFFFDVVALPRCWHRLPRRLRATTILPLMLLLDLASSPPISHFPPPSVNLVMHHFSLRTSEFVFSTYAQFRILSYAGAVFA